MATTNEQQMQLSPRLWGLLPPELVREIFLILGETNFDKAWELRLVSSDVNVLILPVIFRNIVMLFSDHITEISTILLPKRKYFLPALRSRLHIMPRLLSTYRPHSWVLLVRERRPSIETALSVIAPLFVGISKLAITGQNLASNAFWLREYAIHPKLMFLLHFGSPHLVSFHDPIFKSVTHLYTSVTHGHRRSTVANLPCITHLAVSTRADLPDATARDIVNSLLEILRLCKTLTSLVFVMALTLPDSTQRHRWEDLLQDCLLDKRFVILPYYCRPRLEWIGILKGKRTLWDRADELRQLKGQIHAMVVRGHMEEMRKVHDALPKSRDRREEEWEIDMIQRANYQPPVDDPDLKGTGFISAFG